MRKRSKEVIKQLWNPEQELIQLYAGACAACMDYAGPPALNTLLLTMLGGKWLYCSPRHVIPPHALVIICTALISRDPFAHLERSDIS